MITIPLTKNQLESVRTMLFEKGFDFPGDIGQFDAKGPGGHYQGTYHYDGKQLSVNVTSCPFLLSFHRAERKIEEWVAEFLATRNTGLQDKDR